MGVPGEIQGQGPDGTSSTGKPDSQILAARHPIRSRPQPVNIKWDEFDTTGLVELELADAPNASCHHAKCASDIGHQDK